MDSVLLGENIYATNNLFPNYSLRQKPQPLIIATELLRGILAGFTKPALDNSRMSSDFWMKLLDLSPAANSKINLSITQQASKGCATE